MLRFAFAICLCVVPGWAMAMDRPTSDVLKARLFAQAYDCRNVSCSRLGSCAEACYKLTVCGQRVRDGDGDGIPCENLCSRRCP